MHCLYNGFKRNYWQCNSSLLVAMQAGQLTTTTTTTTRWEDMRHQQRSQIPFKFPFNQTFAISLLTAEVLGVNGKFGGQNECRCLWLLTWLICGCIEDPLK